MAPSEQIPLLVLEIRSAVAGEITRASEVHMCSARPEGFIITSLLLAQRKLSIPINFRQFSVIQN